jgi:murein endopeptidase
MFPVRSAVLAVVLLLFAAAGVSARQVPPPLPVPVTPPPDFAEIAFHDSRALGMPASHGRLVDGTQLPALGEDFFTWDPIYNRIPNRPGRRWGTDTLIRTALEVIHAYRTVHDSAPRIGIMDLSREHGGPFGRHFGGLGHASHQNGLDVDILYPRKDGQEARAERPGLVDRVAAQELVDRFVAAGAQKIFVGPHLHLHGPKAVVVPLVYHDDHMHVRIPNPASR